MSTHNVCFHQEIRKIFCGYPLLSVAMKFLDIQVLYTVVKNADPRRTAYNSTK